VAESTLSCGARGREKAREGRKKGVVTFLTANQEHDPRKKHGAHQKKMSKKKKKKKKNPNKKQKKKK